METNLDGCYATESCPALSQGAVKTWLSSSRRGTGSVKSLPYTISRFEGDGVRYKAKLIGIDLVPEAQGDKMCYDSMMKLKGLEVASRNHGKHKQRVWIKISFTGLKIVDEKTGAVEHEHESVQISSLRKDESDPRALAYVYNYEDTHHLFYIKMAYLADPVLDDIKEVCKSLDHMTQPENPLAETENNVENGSLLLFDESATCPSKASDDLEMFNPTFSSPSRPPNQTSVNDELMDIFSMRLEDLPVTAQSSDSIQTGSPQQMQSLAQKLFIYPGQPVGGSPTISQTSVPSTSITWGLQQPLQSLPVILNGQWGALAPSPIHPSATAPAPATGMMPYGGAPMPSCGMNSPAGVKWGQNTVSYPTTVIPHVPYEGVGKQQPMCPSTNDQPAL